MRLRIILVPALFVSGLPGIAAGAAKGWITLINATPYDWKLEYSHQYQMKWRTPPVIRAGVAREISYGFTKNRDDGAEATYRLLGHETNASFVVQARHGGRRRIEIQFQDGLSTLNNAEGSLLDLGWEKDGSVPFILSSTCKNTVLTSNNPPVAWMQASLSTIGARTLREVSLLASHDSGASEITRAYIGTRHNVLTQSGNVYQQLIHGTRYFDIRPVIRKGEWYTAHVTVATKNIVVGALTRTLLDVVNDINQFTDKHPGELIILNISHELARRGWRRLNLEEWQDLFQELSKIQNLWQVPLGFQEDVTKSKLSTFIQLGSRSAVIVRIPEYAPLPKVLFTRNLQMHRREVKFALSNERRLAGKVATRDEPSSSRTTLSTYATKISKTQVRSDTKALPRKREPSALHNSLNATFGLPFFRTTRFPIHGSWSDVIDRKVLAADQLSKLAVFRQSPTDVMLRSVWTLTQKNLQTLNVGVPRQSILSLSAQARREMFVSLWAATSAEVYPNLLEVDNIWGKGLVAFVMAINERSVGRSDKPLQGESHRK